MKLKSILPITAMLLALTMGSCNKDNVPILSSEMSPVNLSAALVPNVSELAVVNLGVAGDFVILSKIRNYRCI